MKAVTNISLTLENTEIIKLSNDEVLKFFVKDITDQVVQIGYEIFQFQSFGFLYLKLKTTANHTYNSFGQPSKQTVFQRLLAEDSPIGCITLTYEDGSVAELYLPDGMEQDFATDSFGNLLVSIGCVAEDGTENCGCGDCEE